MNKHRFILIVLIIHKIKKGKKYLIQKKNLTKKCLKKLMETK